jgi:cytochrome c oxidase accessory protein FixG
MCPWPRIQAAMLDEHSLTVTYNDWRGEPRSRHAKKAAAAGKPVGDCVDCNACVVVCPMGIDIRDGQQLECITCALCIDACNGVMDKLGRERGLISYTTLADYNSNMALATGDGAHEIRPSLVRDAAGRMSDAVSHFHLRKLFRPRTFIYFGGWALVGLLLIYGLVSRDRLEMNVLHDRNPQYVVLSDGSIRNGYTVKLLNKIPEQRTVTVSLGELPGATMNVLGLDHEEGSAITVTLEPDRARSLKVYVRQPREDAKSPGRAQRLVFHVEDKSSLDSADYVTSFETPE